MASYEEMCQVSPDTVSVDELKHQQPKCEAYAAAEKDLEASVDELLETPDINRATFLWQIEGSNEDSDAEDWEKEDCNWCCLPLHWQQILNARLAEHHSRVQDAEAFWLHRQQLFGEDDVKTKNALEKYQLAKDGEGSISVVLISKSTGKEAAPKVYQRCVNNKNGEIQVSVSHHVTAFKLCVKNLTLEELSDPPVTKNLRIVSVTGRSREIQEIRLRLNLLSLNKSHVVEGVSHHGPSTAASSSSNPAEAGASSSPQQVGKQDDIDKELAALDEGECDMEAAETSIAVANVPQHAEAGIDKVLGGFVGLSEHKYCAYARSGK